MYFFEWIYDFGLSEEYEIECKSEEIINSREGEYDNKLYSE